MFSLQSFPLKERINNVMAQRLIQTKIIGGKLLPDQTKTLYVGQMRWSRSRSNLTVVWGISSVKTCYFYLFIWFGSYSRLSS